MSIRSLKAKVPRILITQRCRDYILVHFVFVFFGFIYACKLIHIIGDKVYICHAISFPWIIYVACISQAMSISLLNLKLLENGGGGIRQKKPIRRLIKPLSIGTLKKWHNNNRANCWNHRRQTLYRKPERQSKNKNLVSFFVVKEILIVISYYIFRGVGNSVAYVNILY